jgi:hypothetical protein
MLPDEPESATKSVLLWIATFAVPLAIATAILLVVVLGLIWWVTASGGV